MKFEFVPNRHRRIEVTYMGCTTQYQFSIQDDGSIELLASRTWEPRFPGPPAALEDYIKTFIRRSSKYKTLFFISCYFNKNVEDYRKFKPLFIEKDDP